MPRRATHSAATALPATDITEAAADIVSAIGDLTDAVKDVVHAIRNLPEGLVAAGSGQPQEPTTRSDRASEVIADLLDRLDRANVELAGWQKKSDHGCIGYPCRVCEPGFYQEESNP